jgi:hypothetical protein
MMGYVTEVVQGEVGYGPTDGASNSAADSIVSIKQVGVWIKAYTRPREKTSDTPSLFDIDMLRLQITRWGRAKMSKSRTALKTPEGASTRRLFKQVPGNHLSQIFSRGVQ